MLGPTSAAVIGIALAACGGGGGGDRSSKIFVTPPWTGAERYEYALEQSGVDNEASCTLRTEPDEAETILVRSCFDNRGYKDESRVVVDSQTLAPKSSVRIFFDAKDKRETTHSVTYEGREARMVTKTGDSSREATRDLPEPTEESPDPGWYDDDAQLWLVRGISLHEGYEGQYTHVINAGAPRALSVDVKVDGLETVKVPAGEFRAWKVRVAREKSVYTYWVEEAAPHRVIQAQVEGSVYLLKGSG